MPRRAALFTQADIARLIRGARQEGVGAVTVEMPSGVKFKVSLDKNYPFPQDKDDESSFETDATIIL